MYKNKLSADPSALVLGILAIVIGIAGCCCYGLTAIVPLVLAIIGLIASNKSLREFDENPDVYSLQSRNNVKTAKIINIIAIVMNGIIVLFAIGVLLFFGTMFTSGFFDEFNNYGTIEDMSDYETEIDTINTWEDEDYFYETEIDSVSIDSIPEY
jgi:hypothetical protein